MSKDTGMFGAIGPDGVRTCSVHRETCNDIFAAIEKSGANRVSSGRFTWTVGILCAIAVAFGLALWSWTTSRCDRTDEDVSDTVRKTIKIESDLEHIKAAQAEAKAELKLTRAEMLEEFRRLQELVKNGNR